MSTVIEGEECYYATQVAADVLTEKTKKNQFPQNVGLQSLRPRTDVENIKAQLEDANMVKAQLSKQVEVLSKQVEENRRSKSPGPRRNEKEASSSGNKSSDSAKSNSARVCYVRLWYAFTVILPVG